MFDIVLQKYVLISFSVSLEVTCNLYVAFDNIQMNISCNSKGPTWFTSSTQLNLHAFVQTFIDIVHL